MSRCGNRCNPQPPSPQDTPFKSQIVCLVFVDWPAACGPVIGYCHPPSSNGYKIGKFGRDESELIVQDVVEGNLIEMPDKVIKLLKTYYLKTYIRYENMQRKEILEIPEDALREIIYYSIAHKDYTGADIQMRIYDDHIELWNEGELPKGYTQETLFQKHSSKPRNKNIATTFFKAGYVEAWGRGYKKVKEALETVNLPFPKVENFCGGTLVIIQRPVGNPFGDEPSVEVSDFTKDFTYKCSHSKDNY